MNSSREYVRLDQNGAMRVGSTNVPLDSVLAAFGLGHSPEAIRAQYPTLSLEEVYGAITYCLAHPDEIAEYLRRQQDLWNHWRNWSEQASAPLLARLRGTRARGMEVK